MTEALLDTDILSYFFKGHEVVIQRVEDYLKSYTNLNFTLITYYEILSGLSFKKATKQIELFQEFTAVNTVYSPSIQSMQQAANIYAHLRQIGTAVDDIDILIASIALEHGFYLVTNNEKHFAKIPGLQIQNWSK